MFLSSALCSFVVLSALVHTAILKFIWTRARSHPDTWVVYVCEPLSSISTKFTWHPVPAMPTDANNIALYQFLFGKILFLAFVINKLMCNGVPKRRVKTTKPRLSFFYVLKLISRNDVMSTHVIIVDYVNLNAPDSELTIAWFFVAAIAIGAPDSCANRSRANPLTLAAIQSIRFRIF